MSRFFLSFLCRARFAREIDCVVLLRIVGKKVHGWLGIYLDITPV